MIIRKINNINFYNKYCKKYYRSQFLALFFVVLFAFIALPSTQEAKPKKESPHVSSPWKPTKWYRIKSKNFWVYFAKGNEEPARNAIKIFEKVHREIAPQYAYKLRWTRTHVILNYNSDVTNAQADGGTGGLDVVYMHMDQPARASELGYTDNYLYMLFTHEYTHVLTLRTYDKKHPYLGFTRFLFGSTGIGMFASQGMKEGIATWQEAQSGYGRPNASYTKMFYRTASITDSYPSLSEISITPTIWPYGLLPYAYGARFMKEIEEQGTKRALYNFWDADVAFSYYQLNRQNITPYEIYEDMKESDRKKYTKQAKDIQARGVTKYRRLTYDGHFKTFLHLSAEGKLYYHNLFSNYYVSGIYEWKHGSQPPKSKNTHKNVKLISETTPLADVLGITSGGGRLLAAEFVSHSNEAGIAGMYARDEIRNLRKPFPYGRLARNRSTTYPALSSNGNRLYFVERDNKKHYLKTVLLDEKGRIRQSTEEVVLDVPFYGFIQYVAVNPRNDQQFAALIRKGQWGSGGAIFLCNRNGRSQYNCGKVVKGTSEKVHIQFALDGKSLLFTADPDGIYNIYRYNIANRATYRLTRTVTGFFYPVQDKNNGIYSLAYYKDGFDIVYIPSTNLLQEKVNYFATEDISIANVPGLRDEDAEGKIRKYTSPLLFYGKGWYTSFSKYMAFVTYGFGLRDPLYRHSLEFDFAMDASLSDGATQSVFITSYTYERFVVDLTLTQKYFLVSVPEDFRIEENSNEDGTSNTTPARFDNVRSSLVEFSIPSVSRDFTSSFKWGYIRENDYDFEELKFEDEQNVYYVRWMGGDSERYPKSISPEDGYLLDILFQSEEAIESTKAPQYFFQTGITGFLPGFAKNHVNYFKLSYEGSYGDDDPILEASKSIDGTFTLTSVDTISGLNRLAIPNIRTTQNRLVQLSYEYRLPLFWYNKDIVQRGEPGSNIFRNISLSFVVQYTYFDIGKEDVARPREIEDFYSVGLLFNFRFLFLTAAPFTFSIGYVAGAGATVSQDNKLITKVEPGNLKHSSFNDSQIVFSLSTLIDNPRKPFSRKGYGPSFDEVRYYNTGL